MSSISISTKNVVNIGRESSSEIQDENEKAKENSNSIDNSREQDKRKENDNSNTESKEKSKENDNSSAPSKEKIKESSNSGEKTKEKTKESSNSGEKSKESSNSGEKSKESSNSGEKERKKTQRQIELDALNAIVSGMTAINKEIQDGVDKRIENDEQLKGHQWEMDASPFVVNWSRLISIAPKEKKDELKDLLIKNVKLNDYTRNISISGIGNGMNFYNTERDEKTIDITGDTIGELMNPDPNEFYAKWYFPCDLFGKFFCGGNFRLFRMARNELTFEKWLYYFLKESPKFFEEHVLSNSNKILSLKEWEFIPLDIEFEEVNNPYVEKCLLWFYVKSGHLEDAKEWENVVMTDLVSV